MVWLIEPRFSSGGQGGSQMAEEIVHLFRCADEGGESTVPAGSRIVLLFGWASENKGLVQTFLNAQTTTISLNGAAPSRSATLTAPSRKFPPGVFPKGVLYPVYATTPV